MKSIALIAVIMMTTGASAQAQSANGVWQRDDGRTRIRVAPCGSALCGTVVWLKDKNSPAKLGQRVIYDMKPNGANNWRGSAFNPEDGRKYTGKMSLSGARLTTSGCVLGGLICKSFGWRRVN